MATPDIDHGYALRLAKNVSGEEAPRHALFRVTDVDADGIIEIDKPDADGKADGVLWKEPIGAGEYGQVTFDSPVVVLYATAGGTPAPGAAWGPAAGSWYLTYGKIGFNAFGGATPQDTPAGTGLVLAARLAGGGGPDCQGFIDVLTDACAYSDNSTNTAVTANYSMTTADHNVTADATATPVLVYLPPPNEVTGQEFYVEKSDAGPNPVNVVRGGAETFGGAQAGTGRDGEISVLLSDQYDSVTLFKQWSGPQAGEPVGLCLAFTYASPFPVWRIKDAAGGGASPAQSSPGMPIGLCLPLTYA